MPNFIECLRDGHRDLDAEALELYKQADGAAKDAVQAKSKSDYAADEVATELDKLLTSQLKALQMDNSEDIIALKNKNLEWYADVNQWSGEDAGKNMSQCAAVQQVFNGLLEEELKKKVSELDSACDNYIVHLGSVIRQEGGEIPFEDISELNSEIGELKSPDPGNAKLTTAIEQYNAVLRMKSVLNTEASPEDNISNFREAYLANKRVIEKSRDSAADVFLKVMNTLLKVVTGKFNQISDLWKHDEKRISGNMQDMLGPKRPNKSG